MSRSEQAPDNWPYNSASNWRLVVKLRTSSSLPCFFTKLVERGPGNKFQNVAKHSIRMRHGADPFHVQLSRKTLDTIRINAVHLEQQKMSRTAVDQVRA